MSDESHAVEVIVESEDSDRQPAERPVPKDKKPLTRKLLSEAQLNDIRRDMMVPRAIIPQFSAKTGDKNTERNKRPRHHHNHQRGNAQMINVNEVQPAAVPQNNGAVQAQQPAAQNGIIEKVAAIPYGKAASKGAVFGAAFAASGSIVFFGGRWIIRKLKGSDASVPPLDG